MPAQHLPTGGLVLYWAKDAPTDQTARASDEDAGGQDLRQVAERRAKSGQMGSASQLVDLGGDVEAH